MGELDKPQQAPNNPGNPKEKSDAIKAWEATDIFKKSKQARDDAAKAPATSLTTTPPETAEEKAGELHAKYGAKIKAINESVETKDIEPDREILRKTEISDIRTNARLLKAKKAEEKPEEQIANLKEETARRIRAYTEESKDNWHTINYAKMGSDSKGRSHEMHIGLGDILLDPDITKVFILKLDGSKKVATRGTLSNGRAAFLYADGNYAATYTGDKFRILDGTETDVKDTPAMKKYVDKLSAEDKNRTTHKEYLTTNPYGESYGTDQVDLTNLNVEPELNPRHAKGVSEEFIIKQLGENGVDILNYAKEACSKFQIPFSIFKELINVESGWIPTSKYNGPVKSDATGLGQFLGGTWQGFINYCNKNNIHDPRWGNQPLTPDSRFNPYAMLYATAWLMNETKKTFPNITSLPIDQQGVLYYLAHHEGSAGAKRFVHHINTYGRPPDGRAKGTVLALAKQIARRAAGYEGLELKTMVATSSPAENTPGSFYWTEKARDKNGKLTNYNAKIVDVRNGQKQWLLGSSIAVGLQTKTTRTDTGTIGIGGASAFSFMRDLPKYWTQIEQAGIKPPKQVTLVGLQLNGLHNNSGSNPEANAQRELNDYLKIVAYLKSKGVETVKISTSHIWHTESPSIIAFNNLLLKKYPEMATDITGVAKSTVLHNTKDYAKMVHLYEKSANA